MTSTRLRSILPLLLVALAPVLALAQDGEGDPNRSLSPRDGDPLSLDFFEVPLSVIPDGGAPVMTLDELLRRAEAANGNTDLTVLREQVVQADNNVRRAWASLLPQITAAATYTRNSHSAAIDFP